MTACFGLKRMAGRRRKGGRPPARVSARGRFVSGARLCAIAGWFLLVQRAGANLVSNVNLHATYPTIQEAIANAGAGHTLIVFPGTYGGCSLITNSITIRGAGPTNTIVQASDGSGLNGSGFQVTSGTVVLADMTVRMGRTGMRGGGVSCENGNLLVTNCVVSDNFALTGAGGSYNCGMIDCVLSGNEALIEGGGGAMNCALTNCVLSGNEALIEGGGGAMNCALTNCVLIGNDGCGIFIW